MSARTTIGAAATALAVAIAPTTATADGFGYGSAIDGDTIQLNNGKSVRVIGIDTPEAGDCGSGKAQRATARFIRRGFRLMRAKSETKDHYGRLLRYVRNRNGKDLGAFLIRRGLAVARYDSRDGYGWHRLQRKYHRLDARQRNVCGFDPTPDPKPQRKRGGGGKCDPNYRGACVPRVDYDLNCSDIDGPVRVVGTDVHGFDSDGDGIGCEAG